MTDTKAVVSALIATVASAGATLTKRIFGLLLFAPELVLQPLNKVESAHSAMIKSVLIYRFR